MKSKYSKPEVLRNDKLQVNNSIASCYKRTVWWVNSSMRGRNNWKESKETAYVIHDYEGLVGPVYEVQMWVDEPDGTGGTRRVLYKAYWEDFNDSERFEVDQNGNAEQYTVQNPYGEWVTTSDNWQAVDQGFPYPLAVDHGTDQVVNS